MRVAIYARYSTDRQSEASADDQVRVCRTRADREGWDVVGVFMDPETSGSIRERPGLNALLMRAADIDLMLAEDIDRVSRRQSDIADIFERLRFAGAGMFTLADGKVTELHVGLKGTMSALELQKIADKTRRGQIGRVAVGKAPGGISYGYRKVSRLGPDGEPERGLRAIVPDQAEIVRRIFRETLEGVPPAAIAKALNRDGVPSPRSGEWRANTISGNRKRGTGILNNRLYIGTIVFLRQTFRRHPDTRRRVARLNAAEDWVTAEVPQLRIVDQETWDAVQARRGAGDAAAAAGAPRRAYRRSPRLFSGLMTCGECGGPVNMITGDRWGCARHKQQGTCGNGRTVANRQLERRIFDALRSDFLKPDMIQAAVAGYHRRRAERERGEPKLRRRLERKLAALGREGDSLAAAIGAGGTLGPLLARLQAVEAEREALSAELAALGEERKVVEMDPERAATRYRDAITHLLAALEESESPKAAHARAGIRALIDGVTVHPKVEPRGVDLELRGRLAELLALAQKKPASAWEAGSNTYVSVVAGAGFMRSRTFSAPVAVATIWC